MRIFFSLFFIVLTLAALAVLWAHELGLTRLIPERRKCFTSDELVQMVNDAIYSGEIVIVMGSSSGGHAIPHAAKRIR